MPEETALVPLSDLTASVRKPEHEHLYAIIEKSKDPHARKAAQEHLDRLKAAESPG